MFISTVRYTTSMTGLPHNRLFAADRLEHLLDYQLYLLYRDTGSLMERLMQTRFGITRRRWRIIAALHESHEGATLTEIAQRAELGLDQASRTVGTLCREGYLKRLSHPDNARYSRIVFTDKSRTLYASILHECRAANRQLLEALNAEEIEMLDAVIIKLRQRAQALKAAHHTQAADLVPCG